MAILNLKEVGDEGVAYLTVRQPNSGDRLVVGHTR